MPRVVTKKGKVKKFPYTPNGKKAAKSFAKKTGGKIREVNPYNKSTTNKRKADASASSSNAMQKYG